MAESVNPPATVQVTSADLPLSCPPRKAKWNMHPRVYLPVKDNETEVSCSYCGTRYVITDRLAGNKEGSKDD